MGEPEGTFVDYQTTMVKTAKAIAVTVQEMVSAGANQACAVLLLLAALPQQHLCLPSPPCGAGWPMTFDPCPLYRSPSPQPAPTSWALWPTSSPASTGNWHTRPSPLPSLLRTRR